jgi:hypothetical protein
MEALPTTKFDTSAMIVQFNSKANLVAQFGYLSNDEDPDPELAPAAHTFENLTSLIHAMFEDSKHTTHGFVFHFDVSKLKKM